MSSTRNRLMHEMYCSNWNHILFCVRVQWNFHKFPRRAFHLPIVIVLTALAAAAAIASAALPMSFYFNCCCSCCSLFHVVSWYQRPDRITQLKVRLWLLYCSTFFKNIFVDEWDEYALYPWCPVDILWTGGVLGQRLFGRAFDGPTHDRILFKAKNAITSTPHWCCSFFLWWTASPVVSDDATAATIVVVVDVYVPRVTEMPRCAASTTFPIKSEEN